jgi:glycogen(starch) synthase
MRVCFVSRRYFPAVSGMSVYAANLLRELVALGHEVTMVSQYRGDEAGTRVYGGGPPPLVPGARVIGREALGEQAGGNFERDLDDLVAQVVGSGPYDVVHAQYGYPTGLAGMEAARRLGIPCVVSIQGGDGHWVGSCCATHLEAMRTVCEEANALLIGCASFRDEVVERLGVAPGRFTLVPGAVDVERFRPADTAPRTPPTLLYHGRVDRRKGILDLLDALPEDQELLVSGIGPDLEPARAAAGPNVRFLGQVDYDDVPAVYGQGDVFVSPTYAEGFSNTVLEAMAAGLPIVSTTAVGVVDCLRDDDNGLLVEPGDVAGLRAALARMTRDARLRDRLRATALAEVRATYAWPRVAALIDAEYTRVAGSTPGPHWSVPREVLPCRFREAPHLL